MLPLPRAEAVLSRPADAECPRLSVRPDPEVCTIFRFLGDEQIDFDVDPDEHWGAASLILTAMGDIDGNTAGRHRAFGWPDTSYGSGVTRRDADGPAVHLLQLAEDGELGWGWGDAGTMCFTIPAKAFTAGEFSKAEASGRCC